LFVPDLCDTVHGSGTGKKEVSLTNPESARAISAMAASLGGSLTVPGLLAPVTIRRDAFGIPHVQATDEHGAWFGQGFAGAQDRLWQMEYDRRRACGRWAEVVGAAAAPADVLARRLQLAASAQADVAAMSAATRAMFETYAAGVNAFLGSGKPLPPEYAHTDLTPEPWQPWHSVACYKIRHAAMGSWPRKLAQALLLARIGPDAYARLHGGQRIESPVILPPGETVTQLLAVADAEVRQAAEALSFLTESDGGSNSWAVHGSRTSTGLPVLCNDSHRQLDVPNVYWQVHLACPEFDASGATFPGVPGLPHFGHNGHVAWNITHAMADTQDLYIERFDAAETTRYLTPDGWAEAQRHSETITVRHGQPVEIELWRTRHGPVIHGDPRSGRALALRYTATELPCRGFEPLRPMLRARTVAELQETQRRWVDPVNNLVSADTAGTIGYLTRGSLPMRSSPAARSLPVPGWTGEHEWTGYVPFERLPRAINPPEGFIATANQQIIAGDDPYISDIFALPYRAQRIVELLSASDRMTPEQIGAMQSDTTSVAARAWVTLLSRLGPFTGEAEAARLLLASWDANLLPDSPAALLYAHFRRAVAEALFEPLVGRDTWAWLTDGHLAAAGGMVARWLAGVVAAPDAGGTAPDGRLWEELLPAPLAAAWQATARAAGPDPRRWRWADWHHTAAQHSLAGALPEHAATLNPPQVAVGGDGDTIQAAGYAWGRGERFPITGLSVYRQVVDLSRIDQSSSVVPGGASGLPRTAHAADQLELWRAHRRVPVPYGEQAVAAGTVETLRLAPGG
jgi:penicillin amidase